MTTHDTPLLGARDVTVRFGKVTALDGLDLIAPPGEVLAILGPNGAGKTTFVRTVATLQRPTSGELRVRGHPASRKYVARRPAHGNRANVASAFSRPVSNAAAYGSSNSLPSARSAVSTARNSAMYSAVRLARPPVLNWFAVGIQRNKASLPHVIQEFRRRSHARHQQMIPCAGTSDVQQVPLRVVDLFEIRIVRDRFDPFL